MHAPGSIPLADYLDEWLNEEVILIRESLQRGLVGRIDASNVRDVIEHLESDPHATELEKAMLMEDLGPKRLPEVEAYARMLLATAADRDVIESLGEALKHYG